MNKHSKTMVKLLAVAQILAIALLAGCTTSTSSTVCDASGDVANPYKQISVSSSELKQYLGRPNDIIPAPVNGCPSSPVVITDSKIAICHATGIETNPYDLITVLANGLDGHGEHAGDIIPALASGCPTSLLVITAGKTTICQATSIETNPYTEIAVSVNGLAGNGHESDIFPVPACGCPTSPLEITAAGKITICHATSSKTNPYTEITVNVNGLNGHNKHADDIIPAPAGGCPTTK